MCENIQPEYASSTLHTVFAGPCAWDASKMQNPHSCSQNLETLAQRFGKKLWEKPDELALITNWDFLGLADVDQHTVEWHKLD